MPTDYWDLDDPSFKLSSHGVHAGGGGGGGGGGAPPPGFSAPPVFSPPAAGGFSGASSQIRRKLQGYMQHYEGGGPVMGGPPGVDTVDASLNNGEGVLTTAAMSFPGVMQLVNVLNAIAALGGDPTAPAGAGMGPGGVPGGMPMGEPGGPMEEGMEPTEEAGGYSLGGMIRGIPGVGKPLASAIDVAAPLALQAVGVPLPVGAGLTNLAMEGDPSNIGGSLAGAGKAGAMTGLGEAAGGRDIVKGLHLPGDATQDWEKFARGGVAGRAQAPHQSSMVYPPDPDPSGRTRMSWAELKSLYDPRSDESAEDWLRPAPGGSDARISFNSPRSPQLGGVGDRYHPIMNMADLEHYEAGGKMMPAHQPTGKKPRYAYGGYVGTTNYAAARPRPGMPGGGAVDPLQRPPAGVDPHAPPSFDPKAGALSGIDFGKMFDPRGNQYASEAARANLTRQNQAGDRADINQLQSLGLQDPNLAASFLSGAQRDRARGSEEAIAGISADQANRSQDFYGGLARDTYDKQWQAYLGWLDTERQKQLKQTKGR